MSATCRKSRSATERHVTARKNYICDWCGGSIPKGLEHVIATEFPGGEAGYADAAGKPVRWRIHVEVPCHYCPTPATRPPLPPTAPEAYQWPDIDVAGEEIERRHEEYWS